MGKEFSERLRVTFRAQGANAPGDALINDLIDFLEIKRSLGVHSQWVKQAIVDQFIREQHGALGYVPTSETVQRTPRSVKAEPLQVQGRAEGIEKPVDHGVAEEPDAASLSRGVVAPPPTGAMRGMSKLMG